MFTMVLSGGLFFCPQVFADEVIIHRDSPTEVVPPVPVPPPNEHDTVIERRTPDCETTTVHKENDLGDSKTVEKRHCE
jgi:hypothetical protein